MRAVLDKQRFGPWAPVTGGLVVSSAGTPNPGQFLKLDRQLLQATFRLNTMPHLDITHHFGFPSGGGRVSSNL